MLCLVGLVAVAFAIASLAWLAGSEAEVVVGATSLVCEDKPAAPAVDAEGLRENNPKRENFLVDVVERGLVAVASTSLAVAGLAAIVRSIVFDVYAIIPAVITSTSGMAVVVKMVGSESSYEAVVGKKKRGEDDAESWSSPNSRSALSPVGLQRRSLKFSCGLTRFGVPRSDLSLARF